MNIDLEKAADVARMAAREAAVRILEIYHTPFKVDFKVGDDPVTEADRAASKIIVARLLEAFPSIPVVSEEEAPGTAYRTAPAAWFVDPVDGTREFVEKTGEFCVMIGLSIGGKAAVGVIQVPTTGEEIVGIVGQESVSWLNGAKRPIRASSTTTPNDACVLVSRSRSGPAEPFVRAFGPKTTKSVGSAGLKAVAIARGNADVYVQPDRAGCLWDACAPEAIVVAAGGRASTARGGAFDYRSGTLENTDGMLFCNEGLYSAALEMIHATILRIE